MHNFAKHPTEAASLARVWQHTQDRNIGLITAFQGQSTVQENRQRNSQLAADIRGAGFGYIKVKGRYVEDYGTSGAQTVDEESFLVIGKRGDDSGQLKGFLKQQKQKFDQDSVLYKPYNGENAYLIGTNRENPERLPGYDNSHPLGTWHPNRMSEFHSVIFPAKSFHLLNRTLANPRTYEKIGFYKQRSFSSRAAESEF